MDVYEIGLSGLRNLANALQGKRPGSPEFADLYDKLNAHHLLVRKSLHQTHRHAKRLFRRHRITFRNLKSAGTKAAAGAALAGTLFVAPVHSDNPKPLDMIKVAQAQIPPLPVGKVAGPDNPVPKKLNQAEFAAKIADIIGPSIPRQGRLNDAQLEQIKKLVKSQFNIDIDNKTSSGFEFKEHFGLSGAEQELPTRPGDNAAAHMTSTNPFAIASGITHGRGAWGYVPASKSNGTYNRVEWYLVGRTMDSDQFGTDASRDLGGQRYITIQIPRQEEGNHTFVGVGELWDAGPGRSTGKIWGHSPAWWGYFGERAASSRKTQVIMLPVVSDLLVDQLGPQKFANK